MTGLSLGRLGELERLAQAATPGPWRRAGQWIDAGKYDEVIAPGRVECMAHCYGGTSQIEMTDADADFIAACDPGMVGALLAEVRQLRQQRDAVVELCADYAAPGWGLPVEKVQAAVGLLPALGVTGDPQ